MARWLASLGLCYGLTVVGTVGYALALQPPSPDASAGKSPQVQATGSERTDDGRGGDERRGDTKRGDDKRGDDKHGEDRRGDGRRPGPGHDGGPGGWSNFAWRRVAEAVRRDGGPLELLPLLHVPEVRKELGLDEEVFKPKLEAYMAEMQKRLDEDRRQMQGVAGVDWSKLFSDRMAKENAQFQKFFDELDETQRNRLIGLFAQARGYRAVSNQLVATKVGLSDEDAAKLRKDIDTIREKTMEESRDRVRHIFDKGGDRFEFEKLIHENQKKVDAQIERKLSEEQRQNLAALRGKEIAGPPSWLIRGVDMPRPTPPPPPPRKDPRNGSKPPPKPDCQLED